MTELSNDIKDLIITTNETRAAIETLELNELFGE